MAASQASCGTSRHSCWAILFSSYDLSVLSAWSLSGPIWTGHRWSRRVSSDSARTWAALADCRTCWTWLSFVSRQWLRSFGRRSTASRSLSACERTDPRQTPPGWAARWLTDPNETGNPLIWYEIDRARSPGISGRLILQWLDNLFDSRATDCLGRWRLPQISSYYYI